MSEIIRKLLLLLVFSVMIAAVFTAMFILSSCQSAPDRDNYTCAECYVAADFLYRMKSGQDKSVVAPLIEACRDAMQEARAIKRLEYCRDKCPDGMSENECRLWLNQK